MLISVKDPKSSSSERNYILYDVNHGEGFNLRRDVFMRIANTVRILRERGHNCILVLPPWGALYHWNIQNENNKNNKNNKNKNNKLIKLPWSKYFDVESINRFVPVIEFDQFIFETNRDLIDEILYLQPYVEGWTDGHFEMKFHQRKCIDAHNFYSFFDGKWSGWFYSYEGIYAKSMRCISIQGDSVTLADLIESNFNKNNNKNNKNNKEISIFIDHAEIILHSIFGDMFYWRARRSMRYSKFLINIADQFRKEVFDSDDIADGTILGEHWDTTIKKHGDAKGGNYLCAHWRRRDFVRSHSNDIPSIETTAILLDKMLQSENLSRIFLSTDAPREEVAVLRKLLPNNYKLYQFLGAGDHADLDHGQIAIIDQWICAHSRYFVGTHQSTFSYRIQEDREIMGFHPNRTFNRLCPDAEHSCEQPAKWLIIYDNKDIIY